ncbi:20945_t:CDS:2, partial [Gigaspora margarita]
PNVSVPTTSSASATSLAIPNGSIIPSANYNTPAAPFTDLTNFHMLLQQYYSFVPLFNPLVLNRTNNEYEEPPISDNNQISTTNSSQNLQVVNKTTSSSSNANTISENKPNNRWLSSKVRMLIDELTKSANQKDCQAETHCLIAISPN